MFGGSQNSLNAPRGGPQNAGPYGGTGPQEVRYLVQVQQQGGSSFWPGDRGKSEDSPDINAGQCAAMAFAGWVTFAIVCLLFGFRYHDSKVAVWSLIFMGIGVLLIIIKFTYPQRHDHTAAKYSFIFANWLLSAVLVGTLVGFGAFDCCIGEYWLSKQLEARENVLPSEPAGAYRNVGEIVFADEARVDGSKSVGYKDSSVYCVAPVASDVPLDTVQFWAAGVDCCGARGSFVCDDSWNPKAHAGVVINNVSMTMMRDDIRAKYLKAIALAEVTYAIASVKEPILVRWVSNPDQVQANVWTQGFGILLGAIIVTALICAIQALCVYRGLKARIFM